MRRGIGSRIGVGLAALAVLTVHISGALQPLENAWLDERYRQLQIAPATELVIVEIDAKSLHELKQWPWSRHIHAKLIERLNASHPRSVFFDVDFSVPSPDPTADAAMAAALAQRAYPFVLPAFWQPAAAGSPDGYVLTQPLHALLAQADAGLVNVAPGADGVVRSIVHADTSHATRLVSAVAQLRPDFEFTPGKSYPIDYGISPNAFQRVSYVDVIEGRIDATALADRVVFVGATALELGDILPVPVHRALPGVVVQALAYQTLDAHLPIHLPAWIAVVSGLLVLLLLPALGDSPARRGLTFGFAGTALALGTSFALHALANTILPVMPLVFAFALFAGLAVALEARQQTLRAIWNGIRLKRRDALISGVLAGSIDGILVCAADGVVRDANEAAARLFDSSREKLRGKHLLELLPGVDLRRSQDAGARVETEIQANHGLLPLELSITTVTEAEETLLTVIVRDVTDRKHQQLMLEHQATHDSLTGLPNRVMLAEALDSLRGERPAALFMLDLDRFKEVNDTLGHAAGDGVLTVLGQRLRDAVPERNLIARIGGDEFAIVVPDYDNNVALRRLANTVLETVRMPIDTGTNRIELGGSIGIALHPEHGRDGGLLLQRADVAMYYAKSQGSGVETYDAAFDHNSIRRLEMVSALRAAIANDELQLVYQPKVRLADLEPVGVEALVRWTHPELGPVSPAEFVPLAESSNLITALTRWVMIRAMEDHKRWRSLGLDMDLAINLSARHLRDRTFILELMEAIERYGIDPSHLEFEVTETAVMSDPEEAIEVLQTLASVGVRVALDDFGTGFSSLAYLKQLDLDTLKIDRSFVTDICTDSDDRAIVDSTLQMASRLGLATVAEGIETEAQLALLRELGCQTGQGYWIARPMPFEAIGNWVATWRGRIPPALPSVAAG